MRFLTPPARAPFIGRHEEMAQLHESLKEACQGGGQSVVLSAEPGAGKSELVRRFIAEAQVRRPEVRVGYGECRRIGSGDNNVTQGDPYLPFLQAMARLKGLSEVPSFSDRTLIQKLLKVGEGIGLSLADILLPFVGSAVGVLKTAYEEFSPTQGKDRLEAKRILRTYINELSKLAAVHPVIITIEDLHWADHGSVDLFNHLAAVVRERRVLLIGTLRPSDARHFEESQQHPLLTMLRVLARYDLCRSVTLVFNCINIRYMLTSWAKGGYNAQESSTAKLL